MIQSIKSIEDVKAFAEHLVKVEKISFHPDDDFRDIIRLDNSYPMYSESEAIIRNNLMNDCFKICEKECVEVYGLMFPIIHNLLLN